MPGHTQCSPPLFLPGVWGYQASAGVFSWGSGCGGSPSRGPGSAGGPGGAYLAHEDLYQQVGGQHMRRLLEADGASSGRWTRVSGFGGTNWLDPGLHPPMYLDNIRSS
ncbi:hypothetical protein LEMLEM_LOCUS15008 [Lemmus lemmus]